MDIDFDKEMVGTVEVTEKDALDLASLTRWFEANVEGFEGPISYTKFKGGQSNPTYRIDTPGASYVLRRQPFGKLLPSAHAVDREYAAMTGLFPTGFPVPRTYGLCEDPEVIGSKFFVMSMADGRSLWNGALPGMTPDDRRAHYHALIDTMADLHLNQPDKIGMGDYGKPTDYCARQIARWTKQYKLSETELMPEMERLIEWLPQTIPPQHGSSVVHGDYRLDNVIFHKDEARIIAVLDWVLSTRRYAVSLDAELSGEEGGSLASRLPDESAVPVPLLLCETIVPALLNWCVRSDSSSSQALLPGPL